MRRVLIMISLVFWKPVFGDVPVVRLSSDEPNQVETNSFENVSEPDTYLAEDDLPSIKEVTQAMNQLTAQVQHLEQLHLVEHLQKVEKELVLLKRQLRQSKEQLSVLHQEQQHLFQLIPRTVKVAQSDEGPSNVGARSGQEVGERIPAHVSAKQDDQLPLGVLYNQGLGSLKKRDFPSAKQRFKKVVAKGDKQAVVGDAYYWLGEIALLDEDYHGARDYFSVLIKRFPHHRKCADAWLKLAMVVDHLGLKKTV